jgi:hypothetical protein
LNQKQCLAKEAKETEERPRHEPSLPSYPSRDISLYLDGRAPHPAALRIRTRPLAG